MTDKTLTYKNAEVKYRLLANEGKPTILMLHPAFADSGLFEPQADDFKQDYQILLVDLPGHGANAAIASGITMKDMPHICDRLLEAHRIDRCAVLGISLGSLVAQAFADRYPNRVRSVAIVGGYSIHKANERLLKAQRKEGLKWLFTVLLSMNRFKRYILSVSCHSDRGRSLFERGLHRFRRQSFSAMGGMSSIFRATNDPMPYPLLIVVGEHDLRLIREAAEALHRLEPHSAFMTVPDAGHCANADRPDEFNAIYRRFLAEHKD
ncbi:alpha/beta fold hydrolase [Paenibacillaceae bacterium WGS1546]|uniref:alpha/beta fold hydrolase n=1 Tax=Cohnella sp. WGS1546 TaxID=3366810 RepID=UPI00372D542E